MGLQQRNVALSLGDFRLTHGDHRGLPDIEARLREAQVLQVTLDLALLQSDLGLALQDADVLLNDGAPHV